MLAYDSTAISRFMVMLTVPFLATAAYDYFIGTRGTDRLIAILGGSATLMGAALLCFEQVRVRVDPRTRTIDWTRRWAFRRRSGSVSFTDVKAIVAERPIGDDGVPMRRIVLNTNDGRAIPFTAGYSADADGDLVRLADQIFGMVGSGGGSPIVDCGVPTQNHWSTE